MLLLVSHYSDFLITSCIHAFENYVQSIVLYGLRGWVTQRRIGEPESEAERQSTGSLAQNPVQYWNLVYPVQIRIPDLIQVPVKRISGYPQQASNEKVGKRPTQLPLLTTGLVVSHVCLNWKRESPCTDQRTCTYENREGEVKKVR